MVVVDDGRGTNLGGGRPVCFGSGEVGVSSRLIVAVRWRGCLSLLSRRSAGDVHGSKPPGRSA